MNQKLALEKLNNFNTLIIDFYFPFILKDEDIAALAILPSLLVKTNKEYPNENLFRRKLIDNLIIDIYCSSKRVGKERFFTFRLVIPDQKTIQKDLLKDCLQFFINTIYEPNIENSSFNQEYFKIKKENLKDRIKDNLTNIDFYNDYRLFQIIDPNGQFNRTIENHQEQLEDLNPINTYQFYKKIVIDKLPYIFAIGDFKEKQLELLLDQLLFKNKPNNNYEKINGEFTYYLSKPANQIVEEVSHYNQSCLTYVYKVKDMQTNDTAYLQIVDLLLSSGSSNLLMNSLRTEGKLVYYTSSHIYSKSGLLLIEARIGLQAKEEAMERIEETFQKLKDEKIITPLLDNIKKRIKLNLIKSKDNKYNFLGELIYSKTFKCEMTLKQEYEIIEKMTAQNVTHFVKRLELDTIYYLEGDQNAD